MLRQSTRARFSVALTILFGMLVFSMSADAWYPRLASEALITPHRGGVVGSNRPYVVGNDETLMEIARRGRLGFSALVNANPGQDEWLPTVGSELLLPYAAVIPQTFEPGITVNLAEYRLYLVEKQDDAYRIRIYPIGLGREGWQSPEGAYRIAEMIEDPVWTRPEVMRDPDLPSIIEAGPDNPLGRYWLGLSIPGYGIHGTNRPFGIGRRVSHGCIRLYQADIEDLVKRVKRGTPVTIIYQPVKVVSSDGQLVVEVHPDYLGRFADLEQEVMARLDQAGWQGEPDKDLLRKIASEAKGIPVVVGQSAISRSHSVPKTPES